ncbi:unnamed protein product, partial [Effrenium voratum]
MPTDLIQEALRLSPRQLTKFLGRLAQERPALAIDVIHGLQGRSELNAFHLGAVLGGIGRSNWRQTFRLLQLAMDHTLEVDTVGFNAILASRPVDGSGGSSWGRAVQVLQCMGRQEVESNLVSCNTLISSCEAWELGSAILDAMQVRQDAVTWNCIAYLCSRAQHWKEALCMLLGADLPGFNAALRSAVGAWAQALRLLRAMACRVLEPDQVSFGSMSVAWRSAEELLLEMPRRQIQRGLVAWNALTADTAATSAWARGLARLRRRRCQGAALDCRTFQPALSAVWPHALQVLRQMQREVEPDALSRNQALASAPWQTALAWLPQVEAVAFSAMAAPWATGVVLLGQLVRSRLDDAVAWAGAIGSSRWDLALQLQHAATPSQICANSALSACEKLRAWQPALATLLHRDDADRVSFNSCISACQAAEWPLALRLAELSAAKGPLLVDDFNALLASCEDAPWNVALAILEDLKEKLLVPDIFSFNSAMSALKSESWQRALILFEEMTFARVAPDVLSFGCALQACATARAWRHALELLRHMEELSIPGNPLIHGSALLACGAHGAAAAPLLARLREAVAPRSSRIWTAQSGWRSGESARSLGRVRADH